MDINKAIDLAIQKTGFDAAKKSVSYVLLTATPIAMRGEITTIPIDEIIKILELPRSSEEDMNDSYEDAVKFMQELVVEKSTIKLSNGFMTFNIFSQVMHSDDPKFIDFQVSSAFIDLVKSIQRQV